MLYEVITVGAVLGLGRAGVQIVLAGAAVVVERCGLVLGGADGQLDVGGRVPAHFHEVALVVALVAVGFIMLIIPGIIVLCRLIFVSYLVMDKNMEAMKAVEKSWRNNFV